MSRNKVSQNHDKAEQKTSPENTECKTPKNPHFTLRPKFLYRRFNNIPKDRIHHRPKNLNLNKKMNFTV